MARVMSPRLEYGLRGGFSKLGEPFMASQYADLWQGEIIGENERVTKVVIKVLRRIPTQDYIEKLQAVVTKRHAFKDEAISEIFDLMYDGPLVAISVPYYRNGNIIDHLRRIGDHPDANLVFLIKEVVGAVFRLHSRGIVHGNIHCGNFMIDDAGHVVLADAGIHTVVKATKSHHIPLMYPWKAPEEILEMEGAEMAGPTMAGDIYSLGITIEELYTRERPFAQIKGVYEFLSVLRNGELAKYKPDIAYMPPLIHKLVVKCCAVNPELRPTVANLMEMLNGDEFT